jgi:hypothetical protein
MLECLLEVVSNLDEEGLIVLLVVGVLAIIYELI